MRYLVDIILENDKSRRYPIDASTQEEAIKLLKLRLPPDLRENFKLHSITIDPATLHLEEPYGIFSEE
jgi:hypothetical protein